MTTTAEITAHAERLAAEAPPLTQFQRAHLARILTPGAQAPAAAQPIDAASREAHERDLERMRRQHAAARLARALTACDVCGVPKDGHAPESAASHAWEPSDPTPIAARYAAQEAPRD